MAIVKPAYDPRLADQQAAMQRQGLVTSAQYFGPTSQQTVKPAVMFGQPAGTQLPAVQPHQIPGAPVTTMTHGQPPGQNIPTDRTGQPGYGGLVGGVSEVQTREVNPIYRDVQQNETVRGQLGEIMDTDSPLLQRARARAAAAMQARGLSNSSMAIGAGEAAMYDVAMPIASQDASTYARQGLANQEVGNQTQMFNASQFNQGQQFNAGARNQLNLVNVQEAGQDRRQLVAEKGSMDRLNIQEAGQNRRADQANETQRYGIDTSAKTQRYGIDVGAATQRYGIDTSAKTQRYGIDVGADTSRSNAQLAASTSRYNTDTQRSISQAQIAAGNYRSNQQLLDSSLNRIAQYNSNADMDPAYRQTLADNELRAVQEGINIGNGAQKINLAVRY